MLAPVLRLLAIYLCVGLAVFAFFKRDTLIGMVQGESPAEAAPAAVAAPATPAPQEPAPVAHSTVPAPGHLAPDAPVPGYSLLQPANPRADQPAAPVQGVDGQSYETLRDAARQAYWDGNTDAAIAQYQALLAAYPDNGPANGELGNIYYLKGQRSVAAGYYEKAGQAALARGDHAEVSLIISILRPFDRAAAEHLFEQQAIGNRGGGQ